MGLCALVVTAKKCSEVVRTPQYQPSPSYLGNKGDGHPSMSAYSEHVRKNLNWNAYIPAICDDSIRVITFDVNNFQMLHGGNSNFEMLLNILNTLDATVIVAQRIVMGIQQVQLQAELNKWGYTYRMYCHGNPYGNMLLSRMPLSPLLQSNIGDGACVLSAVLELNGEPIVILGSHLSENDSEARKNQARKLYQVINVHIASRYSSYILAANFEDDWESKAVGFFRDNMSEAFRSSSLPIPSYTSWRGIESDFFFLTKALSQRILGVYTFHTLSSPHLPIIMDLQGTPQNPHSTYREKSKWLWILVGTSSIVIFILVIGQLVRKLF